VEAGGEDTELKGVRVEVGGGGGSGGGENAEDGRAGAQGGGAHGSWQRR
jgi:hypothetical protein